MITIAFLLAYADVHDKMNSPVTKVLEELNHKFDDLQRFYSSRESAMKLYIERFMDDYQAMKDWKLEEDIKAWMKETGDDFFTACCEFDI